MSFFEVIRSIPEQRIVGMVTYPLDEILLISFIGVLCGGDDWEVIEDISKSYLDWLRQFLPYRNGIPPSQTCRRVLSLLPARLLEKGLATWISSLQKQVRGVIAIDGKTLRGSRKSAKRSEHGSDALHLLSAYVCEAGLVIGQRAVDGKSNEITAIPELLEMLAIKGTIISIDAMGTQKAITAKTIPIPLQELKIIPSIFVQCNRKKLMEYLLIFQNFFLLLVDNKDEEKKFNS